MPIRPSPFTTPSWRRVRHGGLTLLGLAVLVLVAHGGALRDGLFYDDHWHRAQLRAAGWNWHDLTEATTFDFPGRLVHMWWQTQPLQWRYPRPVSMFFMKLECCLTGGAPLLIHACGLLWHWLTAYLVFRLARWALASNGWALLAAALFILNPNSVFAVSWTATRNAVIGAFFLLAATLAYCSASFNRQRQPQPLRWRWLLAALLLWGLGLFSREACVVFPLLVVALDGGFGGRAHLRRRLPVYVALAVLAGAYTAWRLFVFPTAEPPPLYFQAPEGLAYLPWTASKLLQLVFGLVLYLPLFAAVDPFEGPVGGVLLAHVVMLAALLPGLWAYLHFTRGQPGRWFWLAWLVITFAPMVPVATMPHFGYLPFAGVAIGAALLLARLPRRWRVVLVPTSLLLIVVACAGHRLLWRGAFRAEQLMCADILATTPPPAPGSRLFFINLPTNHTFAAVALREEWGVDDVEGYVLTLAPQVFYMPRASTVERVGDRELLISTPPPGYFASYLERMFLRMARPGQPLSTGQTVTGELFDTTVVEMKGAGATKLKFSFHTALDDPRNYFFVAMPERPAARLLFEGHDPPRVAPLPADWYSKHAAALAERGRLVYLVEHLEIEAYPTE